MNKSCFKCDICGRFISYQDLYSGRAVCNLVAVDSEYSVETFAAYCPKHYIGGRCMTIHENIYEDMKIEMKNMRKDIVLSHKYVLDALQKKVISLQLKENFLDDERALVLLSSLRKKSFESIEYYKDENRQDLLDNELAVVAICEDYLPRILTKEETKEQIERYFRENQDQATGKHVGKLIGLVMRWLKEQADVDSIDGKLVREIIEENYKVFEVSKES